MKYVIRTLFITGLITVMGAGIIAQLRYLHRSWWERRAVRRLAYGLPAAAILAGLLWMVGVRLEIGWLFKLGSSVSAFTVVMLFGLLLALPVSGLLHWIHGHLERRSTKAAAPAAPLPDRQRRDLLKAAAAVVPASVVLAGSTGIARAYRDTRVYLRPMRHPDLPKALEGLRILHLTDSHLGFYRHLPDFEALTRAARPLQPDLVVLTGDIADDVEQLPGALERAAALKPRLGVYSALGNHEYSHGLQGVLSAYAKGPARLLRSEGVGLDVAGARLWIAGADDPRYMQRDNAAFLRNTVASALRGSRPKDFRVLLSHRPEGLVAAADQGVHLTLAGHTHGGQVGLGGRSLWSLFTNRYLWGEYRRQSSRMYLSSGVGHWFPFRLGCPPEAPVIELRRG